MHYSSLKVLPIRLLLFFCLLFVFEGKAFGSDMNGENLEEEARRDLLLNLKDEENTSRFYQEFLHMLAVLGAMVFVLITAAWLLKKFVNNRTAQTNSINTIKILERRNISTKTAIYLIEIEGKRVALSESSNGAKLLFHYTSKGETPADFEKFLG